MQTVGPNTIQPGDGMLKKMLSQRLEEKKVVFGGNRKLLSVVDLLKKAYIVIIQKTIRDKRQANREEVQNR